MSAYWKVLITLSIRNLFSHWLKTLIVGGLIFFGTALVVVTHDARLAARMERVLELDGGKLREAG